MDQTRPVPMKYIGIAIIIASVCAPVRSTDRVVVTFTSAQQAGLYWSIPDTTIVKQYGRRVVFDLGRDVDMEYDKEWLTFMIGPRLVHSVEEDVLINASSKRYGFIEGNYPGASNYYPELGDYPDLTQWGIEDGNPYGLEMEALWAQVNATDVVIAVLDSGVAALMHTNFPNLLPGYDFVSNADNGLDGDGRDSDPTDPGDGGELCQPNSWHGSKVMSVLAERPESPDDPRGVAMGAGIVSVRVLGYCQSGYASDVADAIVWAAGGSINGVPDNENPAKHIMLPFAGEGRCPTYLQAAVDHAIALGSIIVAAAGNSVGSVGNYIPANCAGVLSVAASTRWGTLAEYSNTGPGLNMAAPGGDAGWVWPIMVAYPFDPIEGYLAKGVAMGTSFAVPHAVGMLALTHAMGISLEEVLTRGIKPFADAAECTLERCGPGILNVRRLFDLDQTTTPAETTTAEPTTTPEQTTTAEPTTTPEQTTTAPETTTEPGTTTPHDNVDNYDPRVFGSMVRSSSNQDASGRRAQFWSGSLIRPPVPMLAVPMPAQVDSMPDAAFLPQPAMPIAPTTCPLGHVLESDACAPCQFPRFSDTAGASACSACPADCESGQFRAGCGLASRGACADCSAEGAAY